jgi:hypothetical protein
MGILFVLLQCTDLTRPMGHLPFMCNKIQYLILWIPQDARVIFIPFLSLLGQSIGGGFLKRLGCKVRA